MIFQMNLIKGLSDSFQSLITYIEQSYVLWEQIKNSFHKLLTFSPPVN